MTCRDRELAVVVTCASGVVLVLVLHDVGPRVSDVQRGADEAFLGVAQRLDVVLLLLLLLLLRAGVEM